jgi:hypothetical protein
MTKEELETKIQELTEVANSLEEPEKTFKLSDINMLKIKLEGLALKELRQKMDQMKLPDWQEMDKQIAAAKIATEAHEVRLDAFNVAFELLKKGLDIVL